DLVTKHTGADKDPKEYRRGEVPEAQVVPVSGKQLMKMDARAKALYWKTLSTTQGRRSAEKPIGEVILQNLLRRGLDIELGDVSSPEHSHTWFIKMTGEKDNKTQFNFIEMASAVISARLYEGIKEKNLEAKKLVLSVESLNEVSDRLVGWTGHVKSM
ncbi:MAG: hypothetical protein AAGM67_04355, partial [Bacteroidota bacterium]